MGFALQHEARNKAIYHSFHTLESRSTSFSKKNTSPKHCSISKGQAVNAAVINQLKKVLSPSEGVRTSRQVKKKPSSCSQNGGRSLILTNLAVRLTPEKMDWERGRDCERRTLSHPYLSHFTDLHFSRC